MTRKLFCTALLLSSCIRPADERSDHDDLVGIAELADIQVLVEEGQAAVRSLDSGEGLQLWAQAPVFDVSLQLSSAQRFHLEVLNCMPNAQAMVDGQSFAASSRPSPTHCVFDLDLGSGAQRIQIAPADWEDLESFRFADMGDIQTAMDSVDEVFDRITQTPDLRFVMSTGDVAEKGEAEEYELFQSQLAHLNVPFFSTIGNHELTTEILRWHKLFGRYTVHFRFKGVDFSYVDSGNASLDPQVYDRLQTWLDEGADRVHIFGTHYPPFDPVGARNAGFRSRNEASALLEKLARGKVDLTLYGHVHSYYEFENAGIPAFISGGGGALPERFDNIDRHFLVIQVDPNRNQVDSVEVVRVDP